MAWVWTHWVVSSWSILASLDSHGPRSPQSTQLSFVSKLCHSTLQDAVTALRLAVVFVRVRSEASQFTSLWLSIPSILVTNHYPLTVWHLPLTRPMAYPFTQRPSQLLVYPVVSKYLRHSLGSILDCIRVPVPGAWLVLRAVREQATWGMGWHCGPPASSLFPSGIRCLEIWPI